MAEYQDDSEGPLPAAAKSPVMQEFQDVFTHPAAREWAGEMATRINDYTTRRQIADDNIAAGENFVHDLGAFKSGLVSGVQNDPFFVHTALDLVDPTMRALSASMPNAPAGADAAIARSIQGEIATAAITALAETHEGTARGMLADERIAGLLGEAVGPLDHYIGAQAKARATDHQAAAERQAAHQALATDTTATNYLSTLLDPSSDTVQFPNGWNQGVLKDPALPPAAKAGVLGIYDRLRANGDIETSDPLVITNAIRRAANGEPPTAAEILSGAGATLTLKDALSLSRKLSLSPSAMVEARGMQVTLDAARRQIAPPEYGAAGQEAFGRFVHWFVGEYDRMGPSSLNPQSENWLLASAGEMPGADPISRFMPNGTDVVLGLGPQAAIENTADRPSLRDIFGGRPVRRAPAGDEVIPTPRLHRPLPTDKMLNMNQLDDKTQPVINEDGSVRYSNPEIKT